MPTIHLTVKGKVQGVFFRATAAETAETLNISGWIKNTEEGDVEIMAHGTEEQLKDFIGWCRKGPALARVDEVVCEERSDLVFRRFEVLR